MKEALYEIKVDGTYDIIMKSLKADRVHCIQRSMDKHLEEDYVTSLPEI